MRRFRLKFKVNGTQLLFLPANFLSECSLTIYLPDEKVGFYY